MQNKLSSYLSIDQDIASDPINQNLINDLKKACEKAASFMRGKFNAVITTAKSDHSKTTKSGRESRHSKGNAVDIAIINNISFNTNKEEFTRLGNLLAKELQSLGYKITKDEYGLSKTIIWQSNGHYNHLHVSNTENTQNVYGSQSQTTQQDATTQETPPTAEPSTAADPALVARLSGFLRRESKEGKNKLLETQIFGNDEKITGNSVLLPSKSNRTILFPFGMGEVVIAKDNVVTVKTNINNKPHFVNYKGITNIETKDGKILRKDDVIGQTKSDVKVEVLNKYGNNIRLRTLFGDKEISRDDLLDKITPPKGNKKPDKNSIKRNNDTVRYARPTSAQGVTQGWLWKQLGQYLKNANTNKK